MPEIDSNSTGATDPVSARHLTPAEVLSVLKPLFGELTGSDAPFDVDTSIYRYLKNLDEYEEFDFSELGDRIEHAFGVPISHGDWGYLSGYRDRLTFDEWTEAYAPLFTFGRLIDVIRIRAKTGVIRPITIGGATSKSAGAFRWMEAVARQGRPRIAAFGPSTRIGDRLRGRHLARFWAKCRVQSGGRLPPLNVKTLPWLSERLSIGQLVFLVYLITTMGSLAVIGGWQFSRATLFRNLIWSCFWGLLLLLPGLPIAATIIGLVQTIARHVTPAERFMPVGIATFGDVARVIAGERGPWCDGCGYELTGNASGACPECGKAIETGPHGLKPVPGVPARSPSGS